MVAAEVRMCGAAQQAARTLPWIGTQEAQKNSPELTIRDMLYDILCHPILVQPSVRTNPTENRRHLLHRRPSREPGRQQSEPHPRSA